MKKSGCWVNDQSFVCCEATLWLKRSVCLPETILGKYEWFFCVDSHENNLSFLKWLCCYMSLNLKKGVVDNPLKLKIASTCLPFSASPLLLQKIHPSDKSLCMPLHMSIYFTTHMVSWIVCNDLSTSIS